MWGWQVCSWFSRKLFWGSSATLAVTGSLESKAALMTGGRVEKAVGHFSQPLCVLTIVPLGLSRVHYFVPPS